MTTCRLPVFPLAVCAVFIAWYNKLINALRLCATCSLNMEKHTRSSPSSTRIDR